MTVMGFTRALPRAATLGAALVAAGLSAGAAHADSAVADINATLLNSIRASAATTPPPRASRAIAMVSTSVFDSVNAASGVRYDPYAYSGGPVTGLSKQAVAYASGYTMMSNLFPALSGSLSMQLSNRLDSLALSSQARADALAFGAGVATAQFNARLADGAAGAQTAYTFGTNPGDFQSVNNGAQPVLPGWGDVTPFAMTSGDQFRLGAPPAVGSAQFIADYNEVKALGCNTCGTTEQQTIARFWADGGGTLTPPGHWLDIATDLLVDRNLGTLASARLSALVGVSVADAGISAWDTKYEYNVWRPVTAIRTCDLATCGVEGDPTWTPFLGTPNFPSYASGHSTFSGAGAAAIGAYFGTDDVAICVSADPASGVAGERCYNRLSDAAAEAGISRIYGGIHYEFDNSQAVAAGASIGRFANETLFGSTVPEPTSWVLLIAGFGLVGASLRRRRAVVAA